MRLLPALLLPALVVTATAGPRRARRGGPVASASEAKRIAEQETGGHAVSAARIPLNGASAGWQVDVHMPKDSRGWRCIIDADTHTVHTKTRIDNPAARRR
jgi:uncharacterized membrane protein YkoI